MCYQLNLYGILDLFTVPVIGYFNIQILYNVSCLILFIHLIERIVYSIPFKLEILELCHENFDIHNENVYCTFEHSPLKMLIPKNNLTLRNKKS